MGRRELRSDFSATLVSLRRGLHTRWREGLATKPSDEDRDLSRGKGFSKEKGSWKKRPSWGSCFECG